MKSILRLMLLPVQAPMLLLLFAVSTYLGMHWSRPITVEASELASLGTLVWSAECLQALVVVVVCTMPDLLLRQISSLMAASRVVSLVVTLLLVITGGLYLLHLDVLSNVLILASTVLLARLDLVRIRVLPPPLLMAALLSLLVLGGAGLGRVLEARYEPLQAPLARRMLAPQPRRQPSQAAPLAASPASGRLSPPSPSPNQASPNRTVPNRVLPRVGHLRTQTPP